MIAGLNPLLRGWGGCFSFSQGHELKVLDGWIRRRLRCLLWAQRKTQARRFKELRRRGVGETSARAASSSSKGAWRLSLSQGPHA